MIIKRKIRSAGQCRIDCRLQDAFPVPHAFEDLFGQKYTAQEKYFYVMLRKLSDCFQSNDGWFPALDRSKKSEKNDGGFRSVFDQCGFSARACKSARKKLKVAGLIECRYIHGEKGYRIGTEYRLLDEKLADHNKAIHRAIMGQLGGPKSIQGGKNRENQGSLEDVGAGHKSAGYSEPFAAPLCHEENNEIEGHI